MNDTELINAVKIQLSIANDMIPDLGIDAYFEFYNSVKALMDEYNTT